MFITLQVFACMSNFRTIGPVCSSVVGHLPESTAWQFYLNQSMGDYPQEMGRGITPSSEIPVLFSSGIPPAYLILVRCMQLPGVFKYSVEAELKWGSEQLCSFDVIIHAGVGCSGDAALCSPCSFKYPEPCSYKYNEVMVTKLNMDAVVLCSVVRALSGVKRCSLTSLLRKVNPTGSVVECSFLRPWTPLGK